MEMFTGGPAGTGAGGGGGAGAGAGGSGGGGARFNTTAISAACGFLTVTSRSSVKNSSCSNRRRYDPAASGTEAVPSAAVVASARAAPEIATRTPAMGVPLMVRTMMSWAAF
jgi:hypothetical protein